MMSTTNMISIIAKTPIKAIDGRRISNAVQGHIHAHDGDLDKTKEFYDSVIALYAKGNPEFEKYKKELQGLIDSGGVK